ncbi:MAG: hypothetical protein HYV06_09155 [Deltaproteobacteria bacterium]|nr:hypothetical protein [Deltaproteobacteria bacterium]
MAIVPIDNLAVGMLLSGDVCDRSGRMLLPAGVELTERHLKVFRTWGVLEADIEGEEGGETAPVQASEDADPVGLAAAEEGVGRIFRLNDREHPAIMELIRLCIARKVADVS